MRHAHRFQPLLRRALERFEEARARGLGRARRVRAFDEFVGRSCARTNSGRTHTTRTAAIARAASQGRAWAKQEKNSGPAGGLVGAARAVKAT